MTTILLFSFMLTMMVMIPPLAYSSVTSTTTQITPEQLPNTPSTNGTDLTVAIGSLASVGAVAIGAYVKDRYDNKKVRGNIKGTDIDVAQYFALVNVLLQHIYVNRDARIGDLLDKPYSSNPMNKITLGEAISAEADAWAEFIQTEYHVPRPPTSIVSPPQKQQEAAAEETATS